MRIVCVLLFAVIFTFPLPERSNAQTPPSEPGVTGTIKEGEALYRSRKFKQALEKFEAALRLDPKNDGALFYAAVTAFRLGNQVQSRGYFLRRAELPGQKDTVKAFCYYRVALTYWREAHDNVARYGDITGERLVYNLPERAAADAERSITNGLEYVDRAIAITKEFGAAHNIKNLLHAEAALVAKDQKKATDHRNQSIMALRQAVEKTEKATGARSGDAVDFSQPTVRIAEFGVTIEDDRKIDDPMTKMIAGGKPRRRVKANFPTIRLQNPPGEAKDTATSEGGAAPSAPDQAVAPAREVIKVEILVSTTGSVLFTRIIEGQQGLNDAAILAAQGWKFEPATFNGKPIQLSSVISFEVKTKK
jgi:tetratricopeptide (TPR) repeat protein